jgi:hypothetical protein
MKRTTDDFVEMLRLGLDLAFAEGHRTVWHAGVNGQHLVYFTFAEETAQKAIASLRLAGCLCDTQLGETGECRVTEDAPDQGSASEEADVLAARMENDKVLIRALRAQLTKMTLERDEARRQLERLRSLVQMACDGLSDDDPARLAAIRMNELVALRERLQIEHECAVCHGLLMLASCPPHCEYCVPGDEHHEAWESHTRKWDKP